MNVAPRVDLIPVCEINGRTTRENRCRLLSRVFNAGRGVAYVDEGDAGFDWWQLISGSRSCSNLKLMDMDLGFLCCNSFSFTTDIEEHEWHRRSQAIKFELNLMVGLLSRDVLNLWWSSSQLKTVTSGTWKILRFTAAVSCFISISKEFLYVGLFAKRCLDTWTCCVLSAVHDNADQIRASNAPLIPISKKSFYSSAPLYTQQKLREMPLVHVELWLHLDQ